MKYQREHSRQKGAVLITTALSLLFLLGFMGAALDFGRLFIVKGELQTAMDSCALAAARELDGRAGALSRATNAGVVAGNLNPVDLQSASWRGSRQLTSTDLTFFNSTYQLSTSDADARYAECRFTKSGIQLWLLQAMGQFINDPARFPDTGSVGAFAVATLSPAQSACPAPVALRPRTDGVAPNYGYTPGEWVTMLDTQNASAGGEIGWANLDGSNSASQTVAQLNGFCGTEIGDDLGTPGVQSSVADVWNYRFGIYRNSVDYAVDPNRPDVTGFVYTATSWPAQQNAYSGSATGAPAGSLNFLEQQALFAPCADSVTNCENLNNSDRRNSVMSLNSFQQVISAAEHQRVGARNRRIVTVPVRSPSNQVADFACMLMLQPISIPQRPVQLEFLGNASAVGSPCVSGGRPGGITGPLTPVLVR